MNLSVRRILSSGFLFWVALGAVAIFFLHPLRKKVKLGIDLVGGTYITLDVQVEKAIDYELRQKMQRIPDVLKNENKELPVSSKVENQKIELSFENETATNSAQSVLHENFPDLVLSQNGTALSLGYSPEKMNEIKKWALRSNIEVLDTRLKKIGVEEIAISSKGDRHIVVEIPDVDDPAKAKQMIGTPAILEFKLVEKIASNKDEIYDEYGGQLPEGMTIIPDKDAKGGKGPFYLVSEYSEVTGKDLKDAYPSIGGGKMGSQVAVTFVLSKEGGDRFAELTGKNIGRELAAVLDNKVISAANIRDEIHSEGSISGNFTAEKAKELAMLLKSGAFVAPVEFSEERRIGPSLGQESIYAGLMACLIGLGLLLVFSVFYYKLSGLFAFLALIYNLILILVGLALLKATLTLPGIAGMVLTVGMAIDASILIYEKMREVIATGATPRQAVREGFSGAMEVILDANITTLVAAIVLFKFGTGPIKGFAVTMMIGIISTLITGLFFLKSLFNFYLDTKEVKKLSI
ncbi:MAG: protein translocase subunit SecD [Candidatus Babeliales bacterium]|nr:protein translocase subunit SecD [Candidatus Babeliales bacterium]